MRPFRLRPIFLLFAPLAFFSCTKNAPEQAGAPVRSANSPGEKTHASTSASTVGDIDIMLAYNATSAELDIDASIFWYNGTPASFSNYTMRYTITGTNIYGTSISAEVPVSASDQIYGTSVAFKDNTTPKTITVKAELIDASNNFSVVASASNSITVSPGINTSTGPLDSSLTVTLTRPYASTPYTITASNISYLSKYPNKTVYFYAFYIPTWDQRTYQNMQTLFLGNVQIGSSQNVSPQGSFTFNLPGDQYDPSNIRVFASTKAYDLSYFQRPLMGVGYTTYFIDQCVDGGVFYDIYMRGLNETNGRFSSGFFSNYTSSMTIAVGSMNQMMDTQIFILKARGFLW